jgi:predicted RNA-binding protein with PUA-like domain
MWLLKTEPDCYSWNDFTRDKKTVWEGVSNALALKHMRTVKKGDAAFIYHTGDEKQIIGIAHVTSNPYPDPKQDDERLVVFDVKLGKKLARPITLSEIKLDKAFEGWDLIRNSRLSVMPVPAKMWERIEKLASEL